MNKDNDNDESMSPEELEDAYPDLIVIKEESQGGNVERSKESKGSKGNKNSFSFVNFLLSLIVAIVLFAVVGGIVRLIDFAAIGWAILTMFIVIVLFFAVIAAAAYSVYVYFAPKDLFWGGAREGTARIVVTGPKGKAAFVKAIMSFKGYEFDKDWNVIIDRTFHEGKKSILERIGLGGIYWIGIPSVRGVYEYFFSWSTLLPNGELDPHEIKNLDHISLKEDTYGTLLPKAETGESMVPIDVTLLITARIVNPRKALFEVDHWLQNVINIAKVPVLAHIATMDNPRELLGNEELTKLFFDKLDKSGDIEYFRNKYGVEVSRVEVGAIGLSKEEEEAAMQKWKAEQTGEAEVVKKTKEGEAYEVYMEKKREADKQYYEMIQVLGDLGTDMRYFESVEKSSNIVIPPIRMLGNIAKQALKGDKSSDEAVETFKEAGITKEDAKNIIALARAMRKKSEEE